MACGAGLHDERTALADGGEGGNVVADTGGAQSYDTFAIANPLSTRTPASEKTAAAAKASAALSGRSRAVSGADMREYVGNDGSTGSASILVRRALLQRLRRLRRAHLDLARTWRVRGDDADGIDNDLDVNGAGDGESRPALGPFVHDAATHIRWWQAEADAAVGGAAYLHSTRARLPGLDNAGTTSSAASVSAALALMQPLTRAEHSN